MGGERGLDGWVCTQKSNVCLICNSLHMMWMSTPDDFIKGSPLGVFVSNKPNSLSVSHTTFSVRLCPSDFSAACTNAVFEWSQANQAEYRCMPAY